jgi:molecular chaperone GrpE
MSNDETVKDVAEAANNGDADETAPEEASTPAEDGNTSATEEATAEDDAGAKLAEAAEALATSKQNTAKMKEKMLRIAADFENFRRRSGREVEESRQRGMMGAVKDLLPVFDNLERATSQVDETADVQSMIDGLNLVHKQFIDVLGKIGIERVASIGSGFDPNVHESIQYEHSEEHEAGVVMTELQPGYRMGSMLLRPAMVVVSRGPAPAAEAPSTEDEPSEEPGEDAPAEAENGTAGAAAAPETSEGDGDDASEAESGDPSDGDTEAEQDG